MEKFYQLWKKFGKNFQEGGKLSWLSSFYDAFDTFLFTPQTTAKRVGAQIHDGSDSKRTMIIVVLALVPAMLFGMFNVGYQHLLATGQLAEGLTCALWWKAFAFGLLAVLPLIIVSYAVGLGIEFVVAQIKHEEVAEGFLVTGFIIPLIVPINTPLWQVLSLLPLPLYSLKKYSAEQAITSSTLPLSHVRSYSSLTRHT